MAKANAKEKTIKFAKNLHISKKSTIFAPNFCHIRQVYNPDRD